MIPDPDVALLESAFKRYYFDHSGLLRMPDRAREREFGYQRFNSGMTRHISLKDEKELRLLVMGSTPSDFYCSNACYSFPDLPMAEKDWKEADLIFDIDAKDLGLPCREKHAAGRCSECEKAFCGAGPCPGCGSKKTSSKSVSCADCMGGAKKEAAKLMDILHEDLGIARESMHVYFSGNEGFHIHVPGSGYEKLGPRERSEISDYVSFRHIMPKTLGFSKARPQRKDFLDFGEPGWRGRAAPVLLGSKSARSKRITEIIDAGHEAFEKRLGELAPEAGAVVDPNVTSDIHRIFRMPGTLNGKSGLAKILCKDLERFDPYTEACLIDDEPVEVTSDCPVRFSLRGRRFGPYDGKAELPRYAAAYLICKGFATTA